MTVVKLHSISPSESEMKKKITEQFCVPSELQLLLSRGKVLGPDCGHSLKAYENICVLIRGKGGMQYSNIGKKFYLLKNKNLIQYNYMTFHYVLYLYAMYHISN